MHIYIYIYRWPQWQTHFLFVVGTSIALVLIAVGRFRVPSEQGSVHHIRWTLCCIFCAICRLQNRRLKNESTHSAIATIAKNEYSQTGSVMFIQSTNVIRHPIFGSAQVQPITLTSGERTHRSYTYVTLNHTKTSQCSIVHLSYLTSRAVMRSSCIASCSSPCMGTHIRRPTSARSRMCFTSCEARRWPRIQQGCTGKGRGRCQRLPHEHLHSWKKMRNNNIQSAHDVTASHTPYLYIAVFITWSTKSMMATPVYPP